MDELNRVIEQYGLNFTRATVISFEDRNNPIHGFAVYHDDTGGFESAMWSRRLRDNGCSREKFHVNGTHQSIVFIPCNAPENREIVARLYALTQEDTLYETLRVFKAHIPSSPSDVTVFEGTLVGRAPSRENPRGWHWDSAPAAVRGDTQRLGATGVTGKLTDT